MEGITLLTKEFRSKRTDDSSRDSGDDDIDKSGHSLASEASGASIVSVTSVSSMVSFLSMGEDPLDDVDSIDATSAVSLAEESEEEDLLARSSDSSLSSKSGDSIVESGESDPEDSSDDSSLEAEENTKQQEASRQESSTPEKSPSKSPAKSPSKRRGVLPIASSDSLFGGVRNFFRRGKSRKEEAQHGFKKEIPATKTRRGGKRGEQESSTEPNSPTERGVIRTSTSDSLVGASRPPPDRNRGVQRTSTSDSLTGVDTKKPTGHAARTRRGGKRNAGKQEETSEHVDVENNANHSKIIMSREPTRGVMRTSTTDSLGGVDPKKHTNPLHAARTRRGGRRGDVKAENEEPSETAREPTRGVMRTSTSDSLGDVETNRMIRAAHAGVTRRGGKRNNGSGTGNEEPSEGVDISESLDTSESPVQDPHRGVQRTSTSDSLTGVDPRKHTNPLHGAKTRRGGRRNRGDSDAFENCGNTTHVEPSRGVVRTSTSDSLTGVDVARNRFGRQGSKTRRGGRRNMKNANDEGGDYSEGLDTEYAADTSENAGGMTNVEPIRGVTRTSTSDSLTSRNKFGRQGSKTRRGGRRNRKNANGEEGDYSEGLDNSEYAADTSENAAVEWTSDHEGRRNMIHRDGSMGATGEKVPRINTVDNLLGAFGFERKRGVQRMTTSDSLTGFDSKKTGSPRRGGTTTPTTSDESTAGVDPAEPHLRSKTTMDKVLGAFGLQRGVVRTSTSDSLTGVDTKKARNKEIHGSRTRRGGRRNRGVVEEDESEISETQETVSSPQGKVIRTNTSDSWAQRLMKRGPLPRTLTADSLEGADPNKHNNHPTGTKTRRGSRRPHHEEDHEEDGTEDISAKDLAALVAEDDAAAEDDGHDSIEADLAELAPGVVGHDTL